MMAKKKRVSFADRLGQTVSDMANAASVAATGSEIGVLELAAEDELNPRPVKRARQMHAARKKKMKAAPKKKAVAKKSSKPKTRKRAGKRR
jgi:hypothetical protein